MLIEGDHVLNGSSLPTGGVGCAATSAAISGVPSGERYQVLRQSSRPCLLPGWAFGEHERGVLLLNVTRRANPVLISGPTKPLLQLLDLCDGRGTIGEIEQRLDGQLTPRAVFAVAVALREAGVLTVLDLLPPARPERWARYQRQLEVFEDSLASKTGADQAQKRLEEAHVVVVGLGGAAHWLVLALAASGIGEFTLIDPDHVELSNLSRQVLFEPSLVGVPKVEAAARWLRRFRPDADVTALHQGIHDADTLQELTIGSTLVVLTVGHIPSRITRIANDSALRSGIPLLLVGGTNFGPFVVPRRSACVACVEHEIERSSPFTFATLRNRLPRFVSGTHTPVLAPPVATTALWAANDVVAHLTGISPPVTLDTIVRLDLGTPAVTSLSFSRRVDCPTCSRACSGPEDSAATPIHRCPSPADAEDRR
jgi:molybdopterin-synthase adenylyltransferase